MRHARKILISVSTLMILHKLLTCCWKIKYRFLARILSLKLQQEAAYEPEHSLRKQAMMQVPIFRRFFELFSLHQMRDALLSKWTYDSERDNEEF